VRLILAVQIQRKKKTPVYNPKERILLANPKPIVFQPDELPCCLRSANLPPSEDRARAVQNERSAFGPEGVHLAKQRHALH
jgi:hypothetical protein